MKKSFLFLLVPAILYISSCGDSKKNDSTSKMPGMEELQIKVNDSPLSLMVPADSSKGKIDVVVQSWGATEIKVGKDFQISIEESNGDIPLMKSDISGNEINKFKGYLKDEPTLLFWQSQIAEPEFHFYMIQKVGTVSYLIQDIKGDMFNEKAIQAMIDAAKTLKASEIKKANS